MQSQEEVFRVIRDWASLGYAPENLRKNERTANLLIEWVNANDGGIVSFVGLSNAVKALGDQVLLSPAEVRDAANQAAIKRAAEGDAKMRQAYYDSIKPQTRIVDTQKQQGVDKVIQNVVDEISKEINSHIVAIRNGINYSLTAHEQDLLRSEIAEYAVEVPLPYKVDAGEKTTRTEYKFKSLNEAKAALEKVVVKKRTLKKSVRENKNWA